MLAAILIGYFLLKDPTPSVEGVPPPSEAQEIFIQRCAERIAYTENAQVVQLGIEYLEAIQPKVDLSKHEIVKSSLIRAIVSDTINDELRLRLAAMLGMTGLVNEATSEIIPWLKKEQLEIPPAPPAPTPTPEPSPETIPTTTMPEPPIGPPAEPTPTPSRLRTEPAHQGPFASIQRAFLRSLVEFSKTTKKSPSQAFIEVIISESHDDTCLDIARLTADNRLIEHLVHLVQEGGAIKFVFGLDSPQAAQIAVDYYVKTLRNDPMQNNLTELIPDMRLWISNQPHLPTLEALLETIDPSSRSSSSLAASASLHIGGHLDLSLFDHGPDATSVSLNLVQMMERRAPLILKDFSISEDKRKALSAQILTQAGQLKKLLLPKEIPVPEAPAAAPR